MYIFLFKLRGEYIKMSEEVKDLSDSGETYQQPCEEEDDETTIDEEEKMEQDGMTADFELKESADKMSEEVKDLSDRGETYQQPCEEEDDETTIDEEEKMEQDGMTADFELKELADDIGVKVEDLKMFWNTGSSRRTRGSATLPDVSMVKDAASSSPGPSDSDQVVSPRSKSPSPDSSDSTESGIDAFISSYKLALQESRLKNQDCRNVTGLTQPSTSQPDTSVPVTSDSAGAGAVNHSLDLDEDDDDEEYLPPSARAGARVGPEYQVDNLPECRNAPPSPDYPSEAEVGEEALWVPVYQDDGVLDYLKTCHSICREHGVHKHCRFNQQLFLQLLMNCEYVFEKGIQHLRRAIDLHLFVVRKSSEYKAFPGAHMKRKNPNS